MTEENTTVRYSMREIKKQLANGQSRSRQDIPEGVEEEGAFWEKASVVMPAAKTSVHLRIDKDVLTWFKEQGSGHLTRMNAVLRSFVNAQKH